MPVAPPKSTMSLREIIACEDLLEGHQEYAIDLLSSLEDMRQFHPTNTCSKTRQAQPCILCEMSSATGLAGAAIKALKSYRDVENHLSTARASLGRRGAIPGAPRQETLFKSELAKTIFLCIANVGDDLRSQHAAWQARLQSDIELASSSGYSGKDVSRIKETLLSTYSGPKVVDSETQSKRAAAPARSAQGTSSTRDSMLLVVRRCLSSDCPCGANETGVWESQDKENIPAPPPNPKKTRTRKARTRSETTARSTSVLSHSLVDTRMDAHTVGNTPDEHNTSSPISDTSTFTIEPSSSMSAIVDPRVHRLREQITRSNETRRTLMEWCRTWATDLLRPREATLGARIRSEATSPTQASTVGTNEWESSLTSGSELVDSDKPPSIVVTSPGGEVTIQGRSGDDDDETMTYKVDIDQLSFKQEELKESWLRARQRRRGVGRKRAFRRSES